MTVRGARLCENAIENRLVGSVRHHPFIQNSEWGESRAKSYLHGNKGIVVPITQIFFMCSHWLEHEEPLSQ